jgi:hypothetical protein
VAAGAHIVTIPAKILKQMAFNKRTEETIEEFDKAWEEFQAMKKEEIVKVKATGDRAEKGRLPGAPFISTRALASSRPSPEDGA